MNAQTAPRPCIALQTASDSDRIALRGVRLRSTITGMSQITTIEQTFTNLEPRAIEAVYTFPLPDGAAVCGFEVVAGDRVLTGTIDEADRSLERYEQAVFEGHGAFLLEQHRPDVFSASVGNLKPGQTVIVRVSYLCPLEATDRSIRLAFPTTIAPRYITATGMDPVAAAVDGDSLNPPHVLAVPYGLTIEVDVDLSNIVQSITSPSHAIVAAAEEDGWRVRFAGGPAEMDRDVVLLLALKKEQKPFAQYARDTGGSAFVAVSFVPEFDAEDLATPAARETIFVLDCSGSMQGESIAQAKLALALCLRSLSPGDTFNICRFGSRFELMSPEPMVYGEQTLAAAIGYVEGIDADLGGTEISKPLAAVMHHAPAVGATRHVIVLTDGQVTNESAVIELAGSYRRRNRIFSFAIGAAASQYLVRGLARATGGAAESIAPGEAIHEKVLRTFGRIASPPVTDVRIDWGDCDVITAPADLPPVFDGEAVAVFGKIAGHRLPRDITLHCHTPTGAMAWTVELSESRHVPILLGRLWARQRIADLENKERLPARAHSAATRHLPVAQELIALSKQYNLLCSLTMFLAIEHRSESDRAEGQPALRRVPLQMASGWHGIATRDVAAAAGAAPTQAHCMIAPAAPTIDRLRLRQSKSDESAMRAKLHDAQRGVSAGGPRVMRQETDPLTELLLSQNALGAFNLTSRLLAASPQLPAAIKLAVDSALPSAAAFDEFDTVAVLLVLQTTYADRHAIWKRAAEKARAFLAQLLGIDAAAIGRWLSVLQKELEQRK